MISPVLGSYHKGYCPDWVRIITDIAPDWVRIIVDLPDWVRIVTDRLGSYHNGFPDWVRIIMAIGFVSKWIDPDWVRIKVLRGYHYHWDWVRIIMDSAPLPWVRIIMDCPIGFVSYWLKCDQKVILSRFLQCHPCAGAMLIFSVSFQF